MNLLHMSFPTLGIFGLPGGGEWILLLLLGLLVFGRRLPEVGRSIGRSIVEFKRGIKGIEDDIDDESSRRPQVTDQSQQHRPLPGSDDSRPAQSAKVGAAQAAEQTDKTS